MTSNSLSNFDSRNESRSNTHCDVDSVTVSTLKSDDEGFVASLSKLSIDQASVTDGVKVDSMDQLTQLFEDLWENRTVDSYAKYVDLPKQERDRLYKEVFNSDDFLFVQVVDKFLPIQAVKKLHLRDIPYIHKRDILPKVCLEFNLKMTKSKRTNTVHLRKRFTKEERKNDFKQRQKAKQKAPMRELGRKRAPYEHKMTPIKVIVQGLNKRQSSLARTSKPAKSAKIPKNQNRKNKRNSNNRERASPYKRKIKELTPKNTLPISSGNKGYRMLEAMGWKLEEGSQEPIAVTTKYMYGHGLGAH